MTKQTMTAAQARTFERTSSDNATYLQLVFPCGCKPYEDIFTYNRWKAQGYQVRKGEKSKHIPVVMSKPKVGEDGKEKNVKFTRNTAVFCRCQVDKVGQSEKVGEVE